jgi:hypothetical protein
MYFINPSHQSVGLCVYSPLSLLGSGSVNTFPRQRMHSKVGELLGASFSVHPESIKGESVSLCMPLLLLGNGSVDMSRQRRIGGGVVFYAVHLVSKENRRLVLTRTSCNSYSLKSLIINNHSCLVPWDSRPHFTVSDLRLPFSSPPTTRRVTVEVFDPASIRGFQVLLLLLLLLLEPV